jgi:benzoyl-CoA reductase/2-hydroxyglutaryl-CoA dehydratase subunit BcrC/BadD/HgdB
MPKRQASADDAGQRGGASLSPALLPIHALIESEQDAFINAPDDLKRAGYFCAYTPPELLNAAGVRHARLFKAGSPEIVSQGERYTQSVFCDFSKSCIGAFDREGGDPFYRAVDKVYNFHTCASMKRASEVIEQFVPTTLLNLPRLRGEQASRAFFREEIAHFRDDVAALSGRTITDDDVRAQIVQFNKVRRLLKQLSELRKRPDSPLSGRDFLELVRGYFYLPPEKLIAVYEKLYRKLGRARDGGARPVRLMISGSIVADGDRRLVELIENEIGARIVVEDHCTGLKPFYHTVAETGDPLQALADGYLDQAPCARMKPLEDSLAFSARLAQEYGVDGVVYVYLKFCACYGITRSAFTGHFQELGIPVLELSSDYSLSDHGQLKTRVEAFVEILNERRDDRARAAPEATTHQVSQ